MKDPAPALPVLTQPLFAALYAPVSDLVFVVEQQAGEVLLGNPSFWKHLPQQRTQQLPIYFSHLLPDHDIRLLCSEQELEAALQLAAKTVAVRLQVVQAVVEQERVLLCIAVPRETTSAASERALALAEEEKKVLLNEVYHRVKNNLNIIVSLLSLQLNREREPLVRQRLLESKSRVYTMALLQERLYLSPRLSEIKAYEYLTSLAQFVVATFRKPQQQISFVPQGVECWMKVDVLVPLGLIVHELVANAVVHAFSDEQPASVLRLSLAQLEEGRYELAVQDNGIGLPEGKKFTSFTSLGVQLIVSLTRQLKAVLQIESSAETGTRISLSFSPF